MKKFKVTAILLSMLITLTACNVGGGTTSSDSTSNVASEDSTSSDISDDPVSDISDDPVSDITVDNNGNNSSTDDGDANVGVDDPDEDKGYELDSSFFLESPTQSEWLETLRPTFSWSALEGADNYTLVVKKYKNGAFRKIKEIKNLTATEYTINFDLAENELYSYSVYGYRDGVCYLADEDVNGSVFVSKINAKTHPANVGIDYSFNGPPSEETIEKYLSRGSTCYIFDSVNGGGLSEFKENLRMLLYTGTKYVQRAYCGNAWTISAEQTDLFPLIKSYIKEAHTYDPDIIFEAGVYEIVNTGVGEFKIPKYVFEAFGLKYEDRCFDVERMVYEDGHHRNTNGTGNHTPDMSRIETQMWFYYRATVFVDLGFESIHLGSTPSMSDVDAQQGYKGWKTVTDKIHEYGKTHARRGWVLLNAHATEMKTPEGELVFDFYAWLLAGSIPDTETAGPATIDHPQRVEIATEDVPYAIYGKTTGGTHPCGYEVERALYVVELDNYGVNAEHKDQPWSNFNGMYLWGYDDISWFLQQPDNYRRYWLNYAYTRIDTVDNYYGHITMPLLRCGGMQSYYANNTAFGYSAVASNDEETVRNIFVNDNKK